MTFATGVQIRQRSRISDPRGRWRHRGQERRRSSLVRTSGHVYAFALSCPHQNAAVKWVEKNNRFECTKHDSHTRPTASTPPAAPRATWTATPSDARDDLIHVDTANVFQSDKDGAGWNGASVAV